MQSYKKIPSLVDITSEFAAKNLLDNRIFKSFSHLNDDCKKSIGRFMKDEMSSILKELLKTGHPLQDYLIPHPNPHPSPRSYEFRRNRFFYPGNDSDGDDFLDDSVNEEDIKIVENARGVMFVAQIPAVLLIFTLSFLPTPPEPAYPTAFRSFLFCFFWGVIATLLLFPFFQKNVFKCLVYTAPEKFPISENYLFLLNIIRNIISAEITKFGGHSQDITQLATELKIEPKTGEFDTSGCRISYFSREGFRKILLHFKAIFSRLHSDSFAQSLINIPPQIRTPISQIEILEQNSTHSNTQLMSSSGPVSRQKLLTQSGNNPHSLFSQSSAEPVVKADETKFSQQHTPLNSFHYR